MVERLHDVAPDLTERNAIYAFDLPGMVGEAPVFPTDFFLAVQQRYGNSRIVVHERGNSVDTSATLSAIAARSRTDYVLRWDQAAASWQVLASPQAEP